MPMRLVTVQTASFFIWVLNLQEREIDFILDSIDFDLLPFGETATWQVFGCKQSKYWEEMLKRQ